MQFAKDSFYIALRDRLAQLNPSRTVVVDGTMRPGIIVCENEQPQLQDSLMDVFCITWGAESAVSARPEPGALHVIDCTMEYRVAGTDLGNNSDRGRQLAAMDTELHRIAFPASAPKYDYTQSPPVQLGTTVCWTTPQMKDLQVDGKMLTRTADLRLYFFPEVD